MLWVTSSVGNCHPDGSSVNLDRVWLMAHQVFTHRADQSSPLDKLALCFAIRIHNLAVDQPVVPVEQQAHDHRDVALLREIFYFFVYV